MDTKADTSQAVKVIRTSAHEDIFSTCDMPYTLSFRVADGKAQLYVCSVGLDYTGESIEIPARISYRKTEYEVTSIGELVIIDKKIVQLVLPSTLVEIGNDNFRDLNLSIINHSPNFMVKDGALYSLQESKLIYAPRSIEKLEIMESIKVVGKDACYMCYRLRQVSLPDSITKIENSAFLRCDSLTQINIPNSVVTIGEKAFAGCLSLSNIKIPNSVKEIGRNAFTECTSLTDFVFPNGIMLISDWIFRSCLNLKNIEIPSSATEIGTGAFKCCEDLEYIVIPSGVAKIGKEAFKDCMSLKEIWIQNEGCDYADASIPEGTKVRIEN